MFASSEYVSMHFISSVQYSERHCDWPLRFRTLWYGSSSGPEAAARNNTAAILERWALGPVGPLWVGPTWVLASCPVPFGLWRNRGIGSRVWGQAPKSPCTVPDDTALHLSALFNYTYCTTLTPLALHYITLHDHHRDISQHSTMLSKLQKSTQTTEKQHQWLFQR